MSTSLYHIRRGSATVEQASLAGLRMKMLVTAVLVSAFITTVISANPREVGDSCQMPNYTAGICTELRKCGVLYSLVKKPDKSPEELSFLRNCTCGTFVGKTPVVCCPSEEPLTCRTSNRNLINSRHCGSTSAGRIFGGKEAVLSEFPWMALLSYKHKDWSKLSAECGGTLITPYYVLTAAHCINSDLKQVTLGEHNQLTDPDCVSTVDGFDCADEVQHLEVAKTIKHPKYNRANIVNDIALIRLKTPATINEYVRTICLPVKPIDESVLFNMNLTVAGWGVTEQNTSSDVLMKVNVPAMSRVDCYNAYSSKGANISLSDNQLCAGGDGKSDSCNGDSGGPLKGFPIGSSKYTQYGIVSFGTKRCATRGVPAVYTAVYKYISWILCTINP